MSKIEDALRKLTPEQRALLELRLKKKRASESTGSNRISARPDESVFPISAGQRRLLALEQLTPNTPRYNLTFALRLMGSLDIEALQTSIIHVLERHQILLGHFSFNEGEWTQHRTSIPDEPLELISLSKLPAPNRLKQAIALAHKQLKQPFNLELGPLVRNTLIRLAPNDHIFVVTMHHIASDAWSFDLYFSEISKWYESILNNEDAEVPEISIDYADFALWQQEWLESPEAEKQRNFWESIFEHPPKPTVLPNNKRPISRHSFEGNSASQVLPDPITEKLKEVSIANKLTPFALFLAAYNTLLFRYSGQQDLLVCAPVIARRRLEIESLIGYFNNILTLRAQPTLDHSFTELAKEVADFTVSVSDHQDLPFEYVAGLPALRKTPLTRAFFTFQNGVGSSFSLPNIEIESINLPSPGADFDLALFVEQHGEDIILNIEYKSQLFTSEHIESILDNYIDILARTSENPEISLGELPSYEMPQLPPEKDAQEENGHKIHTNGSSSADLKSNTQISTVSQGANLSLSTNDVSSRPFAAPADDIEEILTRIWERLLGKQNLSIHDNFFEIGGHSLMAVNMFAEIQKYISSFELPLAVLLEAPTISALAHRIRNKDENDWSPLVIVQPGRKSIPLFCIHGAGGNVLLYRDLAIQLGPHQTVYGLQSQGMDGTRPILGSIEEMATQYAKAIRDTYPQGPYLLLGYCMGGTLAFEIAQQLVRQGQQVELVAMLETYNWMKEPAPTFFSKLRDKFQQIEFHIRNYFLLPRQERKLFFRAKWAELKRRRKVWRGRFFGGFKSRKALPAEASTKALAEVWRLNDQASESYKPQKYPGRIISYLPMKEYKSHTHPGMDWQDLAREVDTQILSVYPAGMLIQPFVKELAQSIRAEIFRITKRVEVKEKPISIRAKQNGQKQLPPQKTEQHVSDKEPNVSS